MEPSRRFLALAFALGLALAAAAAGCKQGNGERCEVTRDCEDGYYCDPASSDNSGGICKPNGVSQTSSDGGSPDVAGEAAQDAAEDGDTAAEDATLLHDADGSTDATSDVDLAAETTPADGAGEESGG